MALTDGNPSRGRCGGCAECAPGAAGPALVVTAGGWFVATDRNGDPVVVSLPARSELGS